MIIKPSASLRDEYGAISDMAHNEAEPIYITKDGKGDLVLMAIEAFEKRDEMIRLRAKLDAGEAARLAGVPGYRVTQIRKELEDIYRGGA
ncbi:prevent-host-death protein [Spirochaetia bacterium]|nr:prevent-host-death protein [Spirochaetia bacterium]